MQFLTSSSLHQSQLNSQQLCSISRYSKNLHLPTTNNASLRTFDDWCNALFWHLCANTIQIL